MTFDPKTHRFGMAYRTDYGAYCYPSKIVSSRLVYCCHRGAECLQEEIPENLTRTPEHDLIPRADVMQLVDAVKKVVYEGVQETEGQYSSQKNNKCRHGNFGYEGCEQCSDEFLEKALTDFNAKHGVS